MLTVCLGEEPSSLFLYDANSAASRAVLEALYDGPFDTLNFNNQPVILQQIPSLDNGAIQFETVDVSEGEWVIDAAGHLATLAAGVRYRPAGCAEDACAIEHAGGQAAQMERMAVTFRLRPGLQWSDGAPLSADDSVFSYETAAALYPAYNPARLLRTFEYTALNANTVVWRGIPGYIESLPEANFYSPLPRHTLGGLSLETLRSGEAARSPLGWGAYVLEEWASGDHITLRKNPFYFRAAEGLPRFDILVYRFISNGDDALDALLTGECDLADTSAALEFSVPRLVELQEAGSLAVTFQSGAAWELAMFNTAPLDPARPALLAQKEVRQAIAMCVDRPALARHLLFGNSLVPAVYTDPAHPLADPAARQYSFDPVGAAALLEAAGWVDDDRDPQTPRLSRGVPGLADGAPLALEYLVSDDAERPAAAAKIQQDLAACGVQINVTALPPEQLLAAGSAGPVFGRAFDIAQFALPFTLDPPCYLFTSEEIPGPYPQHAKGWGGINASGYSSPAFDAACRMAHASLWGSAASYQAHAQAQAIFAEDLPALPLYTRFRVLASRPDLCGLQVDASTSDALWNLESLDYGEGCPQ